MRYGSTLFYVSVLLSEEKMVEVERDGEPDPQGPAERHRRLRPRRQEERRQEERREENRREESFAEDRDKKEEGEVAMSSSSEGHKK